MRVPAGFDLKTAELILTNYKTHGKLLQPYECRVYHWKK